MKAIPLKVSSHGTAVRLNGIKLLINFDSQSESTILKSENDPLMAFFLIRPFIIPLMKGIENMNFNDFCDGKNYMLIPSPKKRHGDRGGKFIRKKIRLPKPNGLTWQSIKNFQRVKWEGVSKRLEDLFGMPVKDICSTRIAQEVLSGIPFSLLSMFSFTEDAAQPQGTSELRKSNYIKYKNQYPFSGGLLSELHLKIQRAVKENNNNERDIIPVFENLNFPNDISENDKNIAKSMKYFATQIITKRKFADEGVNWSGTKLSSDLAILKLIPKAYNQILGIEDCRETSLLRTARKIVQESGVVGTDIKFTSSRLELASSERPLLSPDDIYKMMGLDLPYPPIPITKDLQAWMEPTLHLLCIVLVECAQRFVSLIEFRLYDIVCSNNFVDVCIEYSKTGFVDTSITVTSLMSNEQISFIREFKEKAISCGFSQNTRLLELVGCKNISKDLADSARNQFLNFLNRRLKSKGQSKISDSHLARGTSLSWLPIRMFVARYPELRCSTHLKSVINHQWFSEDLLNKIRYLVPGESTSSSEIIRRIACWASPAQLFSNYCRSWDLLLNLHLERIYKLP